MRHVQWDEQGLQQAAAKVSSIPKRHNRPPPEPKTPFARCIDSNSDGGEMDELRLSTTSVSEEEDRKEAVVTEDEEEEKVFVRLRKEHYKHDGEALHRGRELIESDPEL